MREVGSNSHAKRVRIFLSKDSHVERYKIMNGTKTGIFVGFFFFSLKAQEDMK